MLRYVDVVLMDRDESQEQAFFWHAPDLGNLELLRASFVTHTFARHTHEGFAIGVIERGAEAFYYRHNTHAAPSGAVVVINPGEVHTGQAAVRNGWTYRMLYPDAAILQQIASGIVGRHRDIPFFKEPVIYDRELAQRVRELHQRLEQSASTIERQSWLTLTLAQLIARYTDERVVLPKLGDEHQAVKRAQEYLQAYYADNVSLDQLARVVNLSQFHLVRVFRAELGLPPHMYLTQLRVGRAKALLRSGFSIADVAVATGFSDQSHLTRHFKRFVGITPGRYASAHRFHVDSNHET